MIRSKIGDTHKYQPNHINLIRAQIKILWKEHKSHWWGHLSRIASLHQEASSHTFSLVRLGLGKST